LLAGSVSRQLAACGVRPGSDTPSPFGLLVLLSYETAGGKPLDSAVPAAASIQFLIAAAEALDDLQDGDQIAGLSGIPDATGDTERCADGTGAAGAELVAALLELANASLAHSVAAGCRPDRVVAASSAMSRFALRALGAQHREVHAPSARVVAAGEPRASAEQAYAAAGAKSGPFGRAACVVGASLATDDRALIGRLGDFGEHWAVVDQLLNDVAAVWPGGPADRDLAGGRATVPIALASESRLPELDSFLAGGPATEPQVRAALYESGAIHKTWAIAAVRHARAARIARDIRSTNPQSTLHELLRN
jgi:geranylgeranyl pyrophosphate synthase